MRRLLPLAFAAGLVLLPAPAQAHGDPTCSDVGPLAVENHGEHVRRDYVANGIHGGPGPGYHFLYGIAPGASFCNEKAQSWGVPRG